VKTALDYPISECRQLLERSLRRADLSLVSLGPIASAGVLVAARLRLAHWYGGALGGSGTGYLRHPAISRDGVVFVCDDDLWRVNAGGDIAYRLTARLGEPSFPALSSGGQWLAYVGRDEQHPEVYLMRAAGDSARRMTWLGPDVQVRGFTPEGKILFVTTHGQPFFRNTGHSRSTSPAGCRRCNHFRFGPGKACVIGRNIGLHRHERPWRTVHDLEGVPVARYSYIRSSRPNRQQVHRGNCRDNGPPSIVRALPNMIRHVSL
jgi:hypothetical protein